MADIADHRHALGILGLEIGRERHFHVEQRHFHQTRHGLCPPLAPQTDPARQETHDHLVEHRSIGPDIPARLQTDPRMDIADALRAGDIIGPRRAREHRVPVFDLLVAGMGHGLTGTEEARGFRRCTNPLVETVERRHRNGVHDFGNLRETRHIVSRNIEERQLLVDVLLGESHDPLPFFKSRGKCRHRLVNGFRTAA
jgi:hypothetical protein